MSILHMSSRHKNHQLPQQAGIHGAHKPWLGAKCKTRLRFADLLLERAAIVEMAWYLGFLTKKQVY